MSILPLGFYRVAMSYKYETEPVLSKKKRDFLHGRKNFAKELKRDKHWALYRSSPK